MSAARPRVAVVGAGWAGCAAALTLARAGCTVHVLEAARTPGGRARRVEHGGHVVDNGQHLLLGAYARSLALITSVHAGAAVPLTRLPLGLQSAPGARHRLHLQAPSAPAPLHLLFALLGARGLSVANRLAAAVWAGRVLRGAPPTADRTVAQLIAGQPTPVRELLWEPLCVAALNTPAAHASAQVFVEVLRRSFSGHRSNSDLLIPATDLTRLFPEPALTEVTARGGVVQFGVVVRSITTCNDGQPPVSLKTARGEPRFDAVIVATGPQHVARLLPQQTGLVTALGELCYEPITTLHFDFSYVFPGVEPASPMRMLDGEPGQWLFWHALPQGRWRASVVISAHHRDGGETLLVAQALAQLRRSYTLPCPLWQMIITEKRATYACTPRTATALRQLPNQVGAIHFAGDWCVPELPATLEAAVIAGERAAGAVLDGWVTAKNPTPFAGPEAMSA